MVFEWFKRNYNKFYVKLLIVLKKNLKKYIFKKKNFEIYCEIICNLFEKKIIIVII